MGRMALLGVGGSAVAVAWDPTTPGNLLAWFDAFVGVTLSGGNVDQWDDQSGNGYHLTDLGGFRPGFSSTAWNGTNPGVTNSPAGLLEQTGGLATFMTSDPDFTLMFAVTTANPAGDGSLRTILAWRNDPSLDQIINVDMQNKSGAPFTDFVPRLRSQTDVVDGVDTADGRHTLCFVKSGSTVEVFIDGVSVASDTLTVGSLAGVNQLLILTDQFGGGGWRGVISEMIFYSAALADAHAANYHTYAQAKWGGL